jgi:hypothetical protein
MRTAEIDHRAPEQFIQLPFIDMRIHGACSSWVEGARIVAASRSFGFAGRPAFLLVVPAAQRRLIERPEYLLARPRGR